MQSDLDNNTVNLRKAQKVVSISIVKKQIKENEKNTVAVMRTLAY